MIERAKSFSMKTQSLTFLGKSLHGVVEVCPMQIKPGMRNEKQNNKRIAIV